MTYKQRLLKERAKVKEWMKRIADVEVQINDLMSIIPKGKLDSWLVTAQDALRIKRDALARSRVMRPITKVSILENAATQVLEDAGFFETDSILARRVAEGVVKLVRLFEEQDYSAICGRLVVALFARVARGTPPDAKFLKETWAEIEKVAEENPYSSEEDRKSVV